MNLDGRNTRTFSPQPLARPRDVSGRCTWVEVLQPRGHCGRQLDRAVGALLAPVACDAGCAGADTSGIKTHKLLQAGL